MALSVASSSSSSSSQAPGTHRYEVFISFRGEDTRKGFLSHLRDALHRNQIETFKDDDGMEKGRAIWNELVDAIRNSKLFVVIFSENYAFSKWCLRELVEIMECENKNKNITVIPVFYRIDPTHVRNQTGTYHTAFAEHDGSSEDRCEVEQWRTVLTKAANLVGIHFNEHGDDEAKLISEIVKAISPHCLKKKYYIDGLNRPFICNTNYTHLESLLKRQKSDEVLVIGIWGMGGIGKSTIAEALFNSYSSKYEGSCFLLNPREPEKPCLNDICSRLLSQLLDQDIHITNIRVIDARIVGKLKEKKAFIVLDDVVDSPIAIDLVPFLRNRLCSGSIVILTTRDRSVLTSAKVKQIHEVMKMNDRDSYKLLSHYYAFSDSHTKEGYDELIARVIDYADGIPLALKILGAFLCDKNASECDDELKKLKKHPHDTIQQVLRLSFDGLDDEEKKILLDIACFFWGDKIDYVIELLNSCGFSAKIGIKNLSDKALISTTPDNFIRIHGLIQKMCREIGHEEQTRIWDTKELCNVLENKRGIRKVETIIVDMNQISVDPHVILNAFRKMSNLRLLAIYDKIMHPQWNKADNLMLLPKNFKLPNKLRYLHWGNIPFRSLALISWPQTLVQLSMRSSNIRELWHTPQNLPSLERIDLGHCKYLKECPNLAGARNLKSISFFKCESLQDVHPSIFFLPKIQELIVSYTAVKRLCSDYCSRSLHGLWAIGCSNLEEFSIPMMGGHRSKMEIYLTSTALSEVPSTIMNLKNLEWFGFNISYSLHKLPLNFAPAITLMDDQIKHKDDTCIILSRILPTPAFLSVKVLHFYECKSLFKLPDNIHVLQSLEILQLESCHVITSLPKSIENLQQLIELYIVDCEMLQYIPPLPPSIIYFNAVNCKSLETVSSLTSDPPRKHHASFRFHNCPKLDDHTYGAVLKDLKSGIELLVASDGYPNNEANNGNRFLYYLPSKEIILNDWFPNYSREASIMVEVPPDHNISSCLVGGMLISQYQSCNLGENEIIFEWTCYLMGEDRNEWERIATASNRVRLTGYVPYTIPLEMVSDHKVVWYDAEYSNNIMEAIKDRERDTSCSPILKFRFSANTEDNQEVVIKGCGIRCMMHEEANDEGEISPDAIADGDESDELELELEDVERNGERVDVYCCALDIVNWFQRLLLQRTKTEERYKERSLEKSC